jgi:hypothetical protein
LVLTRGGKIVVGILFAPLGVYWLVRSHTKHRYVLAAAGLFCWLVVVGGIIGAAAGNNAPSAATTAVKVATRPALTPAQRAANHRRAAAAARAKARAAARAKAKAKAARIRSAATARRHAQAAAAAYAAANRWHQGYFGPAGDNSDVYYKWRNDLSCADYATQGCVRIELITASGCSYLAVDSNEESAAGVILGDALDNQANVPAETPVLMELDADTSGVSKFSAPTITCD